MVWYLETTPPDYADMKDKNIELLKELGRVTLSRDTAIKALEEIAEHHIMVADVNPLIAEHNKLTTIATETLRKLGVKDTSIEGSE